MQKIKTHTPIIEENGKKSENNNNIDVDNTKTEFDMTTSVVMDGGREK